jgi:hypothetical protein
MESRRFAVYPLTLLALLALSQTGAVASIGPVKVELGESAVSLTGPWKFHTGDNLHWAEPDFDDSDWETVDLAAPPGAHDPDVGLTGYVPGWQVRGHRDYFGYAWYRMRVSVSAPQGEPLWLCGPFYVDSVYQVFVDGQLIGGVGDFSRSTPVAYNMHRPTIFPMPQSIGSASPGRAASALVAVRVWMGPWALRFFRDAGGIHIAPALGTKRGVEALSTLQWGELIRGYIVDAVEALLFVLLAVMACSLILFDRSNPAYPWLAAALILIGLARGNQAVFFWGRFETIHEFELATIVFLIPLSLGAWTLAWCTWLGLRERAWMRPVVGVLTLLYIGLAFSRRSWFYGVFPRWVDTAASVGSRSVRLSFALLTLLIIFRAVSQRGREGWFALPAILLMSTGLFVQELVMLHVPGIWFPFGTGVSLSEYAYAAFDVVLFVLLWRQMRVLARSKEKGGGYPGRNRR